MIKFDNKVITINNDWLKYDTTPVDPYNPLGLPPYTIRVKYEAGTEPKYNKGTSTVVDHTQNIWDITYENSNWYGIFGNRFDSSASATNLIEVLGANTRGVTNMHQMFCYCSSLSSVPLFDTSSVADIRQMFSYCSSLTSVPLFDLSNVTDLWEMFTRCISLTTLPLFDTSNITSMTDMCNNCHSLTSIPLFDVSNVTSIGWAFYGCKKVESGALALYNQLVNKTNPPTFHPSTFTDCGSNTITGLAELQQIPTSWGGLKEE